MDQTRPHPDPQQLAAFVEGKLTEAEREVVEAHVADCAECCDHLRKLPQETVVGRLRDAIATDELAETIFTGQRSDTEPQTDTGEIPPELENHARYRIVKELGQGGMGVVYQAQHRLMARMVALKVLRHGLVASTTAADRFRLEVQAAATLSHRNIVTAYDAEQAGDLHFLVMEFIEGVNLSDLVRKRGRLSVLHSCNYVMQVAQGLQHAFEQGMVHRDMKPHNLMRTSKGTVKILDFGLAKFAAQQDADSGGSGLTEMGATLGTPDYIAPEQARNAREADIRADIYGLGCTLYYLLSGQPPFPTGSAVEKIISHCERQPTPMHTLRDDLPPEVGEILQRMLAKDPADRFQTPKEIAKALKPFSRPGQAASVGKAEVLSPNLGAELNVEPEPDLLATLPPLEPLHTGGAEGFLDASDAILARPTQQSPPSAAVKFLRRHRTGVVLGSIGLVLVIALSTLMVRWFSKHQGMNQKPQAQGEWLDPAENSHPAVGEWIDLLAKSDPPDDVVSGSWQKENGNLVVSVAPGQSKSASFVFPYHPPREYDLEVQFVREFGTNSVALHFVCGQGQASFDIDAWGEHLIGIQNIDGASLQDRARDSEWQHKQLTNGDVYTARLEVRRAGVTAFLNNTEVTRYEGDGSNLSMLSLWKLPDPQTIGVGAYDCRVKFKSARIKPLE